MNFIENGILKIELLLIKKLKALRNIYPKKLWFGFGFRILILGVWIWILVKIVAKKKFLGIDLTQIYTVIYIII